MARRFLVCAISSAVNVFFFLQRVTLVHSCRNSFWCLLPMSMSDWWRRVKANSQWLVCKEKTSKKVWNGRSFTLLHHDEISQDISNWSSIKVNLLLYYLCAREHISAYIWELLRFVPWQGHDGRALYNTKGSHVALTYCDEVWMLCPLRRVEAQRNSSK